MSDHKLKKQEGQEGLEGQEDQEDPGYVIVDRASDPPPSDALSALAMTAISVWSMMTSAKAALTPNVNLLVVAVAARNGLSALMDEIVSCSTNTSRFLQGTVATQRNLDAVCGAIVDSAQVMKTTASHCGSAVFSSARAIQRHFLPSRQVFDISSRVVDIDGIRFVQIRPNILWVCADKKALCGYGFPVENLRCIEMFHLTQAICLFLLYTTTGCVFASVYTTQYGRDITCLNRVTQIGEDDRFVFFETSDVCIHGTVGLTVFYKDRSQRFFRIERNGAIQQILLICDSHKSK